MKNFLQPILPYLAFLDVSIFYQESSQTVLFDALEQDTAHTFPKNIVSIILSKANIVKTFEKKGPFVYFAILLRMQIMFKKFY